MSTSIDVIDDRTNKNTEDITRVFKVLFGNGKDGGIVSDMRGVKTSLKILAWLGGATFLTLMGNLIAIVVK